MALFSFVVDKASIIEKLYRDQRIDQCVNLLCPASPDDAKQDLFIILLQKEDSLIERLESEGTIFYYSVVVIKNISRMQARERKKQPVSLAFDVEERAAQSWDTDKFMTEFDRMEEELGTFYHRELIKLIAQYGSQTEVAKRTGIPVRSISRSVSVVRNYIKGKVC